jgi:hypothetical protein
MGKTRPVVTNHGAGVGFAWARVEGILFYSCYCSPNCTTLVFDAFLGGLEASIRNASSGQDNLIVTGDFALCRMGIGHG